MNKDELKQFRERIGLNQGELSKALGVANNTVSRWELGQRSIPEFLPLALETIERRLSTVGSVSTVGSIDNKSTVGSSELSKPQSAPKQKSKPVVNPKFLQMVKDGVFNNSVLDIVNNSSDNETLLSTEMVAERLGLKLSSIREHYNSGKLPFVKVGKKNKVRESDFIVFRDSRNLKKK
jgi:excisionase family DNA binding protein